MIDPNTQAQLRSRYNPDGSELRRAQLRMLEMLKFIDSFCSEHDIRYWLDGGTLLGAMRHGGYIPWDDDTDIAMTRQDAEKFKRLMLELHPHPDFVLQCRETDPGFFGFWNVLRDLKSEYVQDSGLHRRRKLRGLQVDIFPFEPHQNRLLQRLSGTLANRLVERPLMRSASADVASRYRFLTRCLFPAFRALGRFSASSRLRLGPGCQWYYSMAPDTIFPLGKAVFEGHEFPVPADFDAYLTSVYGDWRQIPDSDNIATHDTKFLFFE